MPKEEKKNTKQLLADNFKVLLRKSTMERITVKEITDLAGVIRPTFYNHFSDKYELLEYIIWNELLLPIKPLLMNDLITEGLTLLFSNIQNDKDFYQHAIKIEGQNSFESIAKQQVAKLLLEVINSKSFVQHKMNTWLSEQIVSEYYAQSMCYIAISWVKSDFPITPRELSKIYDYITKHSMLDTINEMT